jgi:predicted ATPase
LALELAQRLPEADHDAVAFADLAPVTDVNLMVPTIAAIVGTPSSSGRPSLESLVEAIGARRLVLLLDNLEQLTGAGRVITGLLAGCPNLRILATSRAPLHVRGEHEYPVGPLALPAPGQIGSLEVLGRIEAIALFVERAREISPRFDLTVDNAPAIAEISRRLDGLPLAIELAAAQTKLFTPEALLRRLQQSFPLVAASASDAPARQRTLRDTIAWSFGLLDGPDRRVFARVSVFVGGFGLPDAEAVVPDPDDHAKVDVLPSLTRLVDVNLVRVAADADGEPRFGLLETIRAFASEQLTRAETEVLRTRHARHFAVLADANFRDAGRSEGAPWLRRVRLGNGPDLANALAAADWSRECHDLELMVRIVMATPALADNIGQEWEALGTAEAMAATADPATRARLLRTLGLHAMQFGGDRERSRALFSECLRIYEELGHQTAIPVALRDLAAADFDLGDRARARLGIERALNLARGLEDPVATWALSYVASVYIPLHRPAQGVELAREVINRATAIDFQEVIAVGHDGLGIALLAIGDFDGAIEALSEAARMWRRMGQESRPNNAAVAMLGIARLRAGQLEESRSLLKTAAASDIQSGVIWKGLTTLEGQADWLGAAGRPGPATVCWAAVDQIRLRTRDRTAANDFALFAVSRQRDRLAVTPAVRRSDDTGTGAGPRGPCARRDRARSRRGGPRTPKPLRPHTT